MEAIGMVMGSPVPCNTPAMSTRQQASTPAVAAVVAKRPEEGQPSRKARHREDYHVRFSSPEQEEGTDDAAAAVAARNTRDHGASRQAQVSDQPADRQPAQNIETRPSLSGSLHQSIAPDMTFEALERRAATLQPTRPARKGKQAPLGRGPQPLQDSLQEANRAAFGAFSLSGPKALGFPGGGGGGVDHRQAMQPEGWFEKTMMQWSATPAARAPLSLFSGAGAPALPSSLLGGGMGARNVSAKPRPISLR